MKRVSLLFVLLAAVSFGTLTACQQTDPNPETPAEETTPEAGTEAPAETAPAPEPEATTTPQSSVETPETQAVETPSDVAPATPVVSPAGETSEVTEPVVIEENAVIEESVSDPSAVESGVEEESLSVEEIEPPADGTPAE